jgi:hypothetical protein
MLSNNVRRVFNRRALAAGVVVVLAGALVIGLMSFASPKAASAAGLQVHDPKGLTVKLNFRTSGKALELIGCTATELGASERKCILQTSPGPRPPRNLTGQVAIEWNGLATGSGCVIVGGVEYCW